MQHEKRQARVSVVMPSYNNATYLKAAIDSVLDQDYPNLELIVVDDGSTDDSVTILKGYGERIRFICQSNQGPAAARNTGLREVSGDYVAFHDSDDLWLPGKVHAQVELLQQHPEYVACYTRWLVWDGSEMKQPLLNPHEDLIISDFGTGWLYVPLLKVSLLHTITVMIRRDAVRQVGFFSEDLRIGEDHHYWLRLSRLGQIAKLKSVYALYRENPRSTTNRVHLRNYSLEVLQWALDTFGPSCPSGQVLQDGAIQSYLGERNFNYGYQCFWGGRKDLAASAFQESYRFGYLPKRSAMYWLMSQFALKCRLAKRARP